MGKVVNKRELAETLGKSEATLTAWQKEGLPVRIAQVAIGLESMREIESVVRYEVYVALNELSTAIAPDGEAEGA